MDPREVLQDGNRRFLRQHMDFCFGPMFPQCSKCGHHDGDITQLLELDGQDLHRRGERGALQDFFKF
jgi:hypothetical protein